MTKITALVLATALLSAQAQAAYLLNFNCEGVDNAGHKALVSMVGIASPNPPIGKTTFDVKVSVSAETETGTLNLKEVPYKGIKTVYSGLEQYGVSLETETEAVIIAINNKNESSLTIYNPSTDESQEFNLVCEDK